MTTDGGGWTVIQKRLDGSVDFYRTSKEYRNGFGNIEGEYWLGNEKIHQLTTQRNQSLRIDMMDDSGMWKYATYSNFNISSNATGYKLSLKNYHGNADMSGPIPVVDFSAYGLDKNNADVVENEMIKLSETLNNAFSQNGCFYITNHGIPEKMIEEVHKYSRQFFLKDNKLKHRFARTDECIFGWVGMEEESIKPGTPGDIKEAFNFLPEYANSRHWYEETDLKLTLEKMYERCTFLSLRIMDIISMGLKLKDTAILRNGHSRIGTKDNRTTLKTFIYPEISSNRAIKEGQQRCGEHTDAGTITLLFQDDVGGLEVKPRDGDYVQVVPIPGTILVNTGMMLQRLTADKYIANLHRVLIPRVENKQKSRQSFAFFVNLDNEEPIKCVDGSNKYEPMAAQEYFDYRFREMYKH